MAAEYEEKDTQKEYQRLLKSIKPLIHNLRSSKDATLCLLWLSKLDGASASERPLRNGLLTQLRENVLNERLEYPFSQSPPPDGLLGKFLDQESAVPTMRSTAQDLDSLEPSVLSFDDLSPDNGIAKYRERAKKYKATISQYQAMLKSILDSSLKESAELAKLPSNLEPPEPPICRCDENDEAKIETDSPLLVKADASDLLQRIQRLEEENADLHAKYNNVEDTLKKTTSVVAPSDRRGLAFEIPLKPTKDRERNKRHKQRNKIVEKFRAELQKVVEVKDKIIAELEDELKNRTIHATSIEHEELEHTVLQKCNQLEEKYQKLLDTAAEQHKKEREADKKTIEKLQNLLLSAGKDT